MKDSDFEPRSLSAVIHELVDGFSALFKSEMKLAKVELRQNVKNTAAKGAVGVAFALMAWLGIQALVVAAVIGLGDLLGGHYGWSAAIIGAILTGIGGALALAAFKKISDVSLQKSERSRLEDKAMIQEHFHDITANLKQRAS